jgi:hypothetical protein
VCRSKHVELPKNFGIINSITKLHLVGISTEQRVCMKYCFLLGKSTAEIFLMLKEVFKKEAFKKEAQVHEWY